jgi:hypothetical protein
MSRLVGVIAAVIAAGVLAVTALAGQSPRVLLASILRNARAQHSVHYTSWSSLGASAVLIVHADVARERGIVRLTTKVFGKKSDTTTVVVVRKTAYVRGDAAALEDWLELSRAKSARYAGWWISIRPGHELYGEVAGGGTLRSFLHQITPRGRLKSEWTTIKGRRVIEISHTSDAGSQALYVRHSGRLPIAAAYVAAGGQGKTTIRRWNEGVQVRPPAYAVPISTVRS